MTSRPIVSVIMIFYQAERFLSDAVESVVNQSMSEWELLMVDDGSTDRSSALAKAWAAGDPDRIRYLCHPGGVNRGMAASRKLGMAAAVGRYIAFLDADDVFLPDRLRHHLSIIERMPGPGVVVGSELYWFSWDAEADRRYTQRDFVMTAGVTPGVVFAPPRLLSLLVAPRGAAMPGICSVTFHRLDLDGLEGPPDQFTGLYEDQCLIATLLAHRPCVVTEESLAKYRIHSMSSTAVASARGANRRLPGSCEHRFLVWLDSYVRRNGILAPGLRESLDARLFLYERPRLALAVEYCREATERARARIVVVLRSLFEDRRFDILRRVRERVRRRRVQMWERRFSRTPKSADPKRQCAEIATRKARSHVPW